MRRNMTAHIIAPITFNHLPVSTVYDMLRQRKTNGMIKESVETCEDICQGIILGEVLI